MEAAPAAEAGRSPRSHRSRRVVAQRMPGRAPAVRFSPHVSGCTRGWRSPLWPGRRACRRGDGPSNSVRQGAGRHHRSQTCAQGQGRCRRVEGRSQGQLGRLAQGNAASDRGSIRKAFKTEFGRPQGSRTCPARDGHMTGSTAPFGPWSPDVDSVERVAQLRALCALAAVFCSSQHPLVAELRRAETDPDAAERALTLLDALPSLTRRRLISVFAVVTFPKVSKPRQGRPSIAPNEPAAAEVPEAPERISKPVG